MVPKTLDVALEKLIGDLRSFVELSLKESELSWSDWMDSIERKVTVKCWEENRCTKTFCPAHGNTCRRCWLIAGTLCGETIESAFSTKFRSCSDCHVYLSVVHTDPVSEMYEHVITLIHSLRVKQEELKYLAVRDATTGLHNRNFLEMVFPVEMEKVKRHGNRLVIIMIDVNDFKFVNDNFGHLFGDEILKACGTLLKKSVRSADTLVRYGGDEFMVITPLTEIGDDEALIRRIRDNVRSWNREWSGRNIRLSLSIGSSLYDGSRSITEVIAEADRKMYSDKKKRIESMDG